MPELQIDIDMVEFLKAAWARLKNLDENKMVSARTGEYETATDGYLDLEECPFCGEFMAYPESDGGMHWHIRCRYCDCRTGNIFADGSNPVVCQPYEAVIADIDDDLAKFTDGRMKEIPDCKWQLRYKQYMAMMSMVAVWFAAEAWNRRVRS